jgi:hypothetical protein
MRDQRTIRRTNREGIGDAKIAARRPLKASRNRRYRAASVNIVTKLSACRTCPVAQTGTGGPSVGQTGKESALAKSPPAPLQRQAAIAAVGLDHQVLVNARLDPWPIIGRAMSKASASTRYDDDGGYGGTRSFRLCLKPGDGDQSLQEKSPVLENLTAQNFVTEALAGGPCIRRRWKCTGVWDS